MNAHSALKQYKTEMATEEVNESDPHALIQMLMEGALKNIALAKTIIQKGNLTSSDIAGKGNAISSAISILDCLSASLDHEQGGSIASNLEKLYEYMVHTLVEANVNNDASKLEEVTKLLLDIKSAWDAIRGQAMDILKQKEAGTDPQEEGTTF